MEGWFIGTERCDGEVGERVSREEDGRGDTTSEEEESSRKKQEQDQQKGMPNFDPNSMMKNASSMANSIPKY